MSNDALERLKQRQRPTVKSRDASLISSSTDISTSRYQDTQKSLDPAEPLKTKQTTLRLEVGLSERLSEVCQANGISREVFLEALFEHYETEREARQEILAEAQKKASHRMQIANLKRARSMMQRFS
jgi:hypothetical protein